MAAWVVLLASGCGGSDDGVTADPSVAPFVGDWSASSLVITSKANPDVSTDVIADFNATFTINVQASGQYTAILLFAGQSQTEIGTISVSGSTVTMKVEVPEARTDVATFSFPDADHLILDGSTTFDFNLDGTAEPATAHFDLARK
jgi:hypothetical protein